jgi:hypothetical protein
MSLIEKHYHGSSEKLHKYERQLRTKKSIDAILEQHRKSNSTNDTDGKATNSSTIHHHKNSSLQSVITGADNRLQRESFTKKNQSLYSNTAQQRKFAKTFFKIYLGYLTQAILQKISLIEARFDFTHLMRRCKIGYLINVEQNLLNDIVGTKEELKDLMVASGILGVNKEDDSRRAVVSTLGEGLLSRLQKKFKLDLSPRTYFVQAYLNEDYIQLTLYQVVKIAPFDEEKEEEEATAIMIRDRIIPIENIYDSLYKKIWNNMTLGDNDGFVNCCKLNKSHIDDNLALPQEPSFDSSLKSYTNTIPKLKNFICEVII